MSAKSVVARMFHGENQLHQIIVTEAIATLLGKGDGTFSVSASANLPGDTSAFCDLCRNPFAPNLVIADLNNDRRLDLIAPVVVPDPSIVGGQSSAIWALLGNGDGTFQAAQKFNLAAAPSWLVVGDFNEDTLADVCVTNSSANNISIFLNVPLPVSLSTTFLSFNAQVMGTTSAAQPVTLTNASGGTLTFTSIVTSGDFAIAPTGTTCSTANSVAAGANCTINVTFTPTATGNRTGTVTITNNAPGSPRTVALSGTGTDFSIAAASGSSTSATIPAGGTATYTLAFTGTTGFNGTVSLACSGAPPASTCTPNPTSLTLRGTSTVSATVSVATTARSIGAPRRHLGPPIAGSRRGLPQLFWWLLAVMLASLAAARRRRAWLGAGAALLCVLLLAALAMPACGGGGGPPPPPPGTPAGTYPLTVTSTYTSGSSTLTHKTNLALTVQ